MRGKTACCAAMLALLAACGGGDAEVPKEAAPPATLPAGDYEVTLTTTSLGKPSSRIGGMRPRKPRAVLPD